MLVSFIIAVAAVGAINTLLAILIMLADATIGNYGDCKLTINDAKELTVKGGKPLLSALKDEQIFIPSACGGRGSCGLCKLVIEDGGGDLLPTELPWLDADEQKSGVRLSCQVKVKRDMRLRIPEELFSVKQFSATVSAINDLTHDIKEVKIKLSEPAAIEFTAGQFIQLEVPPYELTDEPVYRAYSIASDPVKQDEIELEIRYVPNGICTTYVHKHLKEGDEVTFNGPYGDFHLQPTEADIICIAGGSGMAPIKSILEEMARTGSKRKAVYFFGARSKRDLFLVERMQALEKELPQFKFIPALSEPQPEDNWDGETGLITEVVAKHVPDASGKEAYLCGSPLMIDACVKVLQEKGMSEDNIYYDKFA